MASSLPETTLDFMHLDWAQIAPFFADLEARPLTPASVDAWLADNLTNLGRFRDICQVDISPRID